MSFLSNLFGKGKKGNPDIPITKLPSAPAEGEGTEVRLPSPQKALPEIKDTKPFEEKQIPVWQPGDVILEHYEIEDVITSGGMGRIYIANHQNWKVKIAIKSPTEELLKDKDFFSRVQKEAEAWTELGLHPNIAYCYFVRNIEDVPHIFVEYVDGGNLRQWIEDGRCADLKTGLDLAIQFCHGMAHAHSKGMVHRDIKPANILMTQDGILKVTDFGIAKIGASEDTPASPTFGKIPPSIPFSKGGMRGLSDESKTIGFIGTMAYASPEQLRDAHSVGPETDIFSFGLCLWEMLCGRKPYHIAVVKEEIPDTRKLRPDLPESLHVLLEQLVAFEKEKRQKLGGFEALRERFKSIYIEIFKEPSRQSELEKIDLEADGLNNRGVSYFELGKVTAAEECFRETLTKDAIHPQATYNLGLLEWKAGRITDAEVVRLLEILRLSHTPEVIEPLLARIHVARFQPSIAREMLNDFPGLFEEMFGGMELPEIRCLATLEGHTSSVQSVSFSPDGKRALSGSETVRLWDLDTRQCLATMEGHTSAVYSVSFSPDGKRALSGSDDKTVRLWDIDTGQCLAILEGHTYTVTSVSFSPDGKRALSGSIDETVRLWDLDRRQCLVVLEGHTSLVKSVSFSPDGKRALSGGWDKTVRLWDLDTTQCLATMEGHTDYVESVSFSPDGKRALSGSGDKTVRLWDLDTTASLFKAWKCLSTLKGHTRGVNSVSFSPDGKRALSGSGDKTVRLWDLDTRQCLTTLEGHTHSISSVSFSPDGKRALSGSEDTTVRLYLTQTTCRPKCEASLEFCLPRGFLELKQAKKEMNAVIEEVDSLIHSGECDSALDKLIDYWKRTNYAAEGSMETRYFSLYRIGAVRGMFLAHQYTQLEGHTEVVTSVSFSPDGKRALSGSGDKTVRLWDLDTGQCLATMEGTKSIYSVWFSPDGKKVLSGGGDKTVRLWDLDTGQCLTTMEGHTDYVESVSFSPDGKRALSGGWDKTVRLWDLDTGQCLAILEGHTYTVTSVSFSPDGKRALSGSSDKTVRLWDLDTGQSMATMEGHTDRVTSVNFSPDGKRALSGSWDNTVRLWDLNTMQCLATMGGTNSAYYVCFSPNGKRVLSGGLDNTVRLWDLDTMQCLATLKGHTDLVTSVSFSPDGKWALSGSADGTLRLWRFIWDLEFPEPVDWDEGVRPYLEIFLTLHNGRWTETDFHELIGELAEKRGYGWVRPDGIRRELEKMTQEYRG